MTEIKKKNNNFPIRFYSIFPDNCENDKGPTTVLTAQAKNPNREAFELKGEVHKAAVSNKAQGR